MENMVEEPFLRERSYRNSEWILKQVVRYLVLKDQIRILFFRMEVKLLGFE